MDETGPKLRKRENLVTWYNLTFDICRNSNNQKQPEKNVKNDFCCFTESLLNHSGRETTVVKLDYEQSLFFLDPSSETPETRK